MEKWLVLIFGVLSAFFIGSLVFGQSQEDQNVSLEQVVETFFVEGPSERNRKEELEDSAILQKGDVIYSVPFISQAPNGQWEDPRFQDGCEEASIIMAMAWVRDKEAITQEEAIQAILAMSDFTEKTFGDFLDLSAEDTAELMRTYYGYENISVRYKISSENVKQALYRGSIVIVPADGRKLNNPYFSGGGPENHMLVIIGYDPETDIFTTNDPGTKRGAGYEYSSSVVDTAVRDYPTGYHEPNPDPKTAMIEVWR